MTINILTGQGTWSLASADFVNPSYLSIPVGGVLQSASAGFDITDMGTVVVSFIGTYTGQTVVHEQTLDRTGAVGWFPVLGTPNTGGTAVSSGATAGTAYIFPAAGVRHRIRITALSTGTITAQVATSAEVLSTGGSSGGGGGGAVTIADGADVTQGALADAAWDYSAAATVVSILKALTTANGYAQGTSSVSTRGPMMQAKVNSAAAGETYTTAQVSPFSMFTNGELRVGGGVASGTADTGAPLKVGFQFQTATNLTALTAGQRVNAQGDDYGNLRVAAALPTVSPNDGQAYNVGLAYNRASGATGSAVIPGVAPYLASSSANFDRARTITYSFGSALGVAAVEAAGSPFANITTATTTVVKSGAGILHKIIINTHVASATITIFDNTAGSGTKIGTITLPSTITSDDPTSLAYDLGFSTGLTLVTSGTTDLTVVYR